MQPKTTATIWPVVSLLVGLSDADPRPDDHLSPAEVSAVVACHREAKSGNLSEDEHDDNLQKQTRTAVRHALQAEQLGQGGRGVQSKDGEAH